MASNDGKGSKHIQSRYELVWREVTASTGLSWNVSSRFHWQTRCHSLRNTFNLKGRLIGFFSMNTKKCPFPNSHTLLLYAQCKCSFYCF